MSSQPFICFSILFGSIASLLLILLCVVHVDRRDRVRLRAYLTERERIIRELHDTLLQGTQGFILTVQAAASRLPLGDAVRQTLEEALNRADAVMAENRDRIQDVRPAARGANDLLQSLSTFADELGRDRPVAFRLIVDGDARDLDPHVADEVHRIAREALQNAFRRAGASAVEVQVVYGDAEFSLRVRDDGDGKDSTTIQTQQLRRRWRLPRMRDRTLDISAHFEVWSRPGAGTEIQLRIDSRSAYAAKRFGAREPRIK